MRKLVVLANALLRGNESAPRTSLDNHGYSSPRSTLGRMLRKLHFLENRPLLNYIFRGCSIVTVAICV